MQRKKLWQEQKIPLLCFTETLLNKHVSHLFLNIPITLNISKNSFWGNVCGTCSYVFLIYLPKYDMLNGRVERRVD